MIVEQPDIYLHELQVKLKSNGQPGGVPSICDTTV